MSKLGIEARVGAFVLAALAVLAGFVLALGDFSLAPGVRIYADFAFTGGLQEGAPVMMSGVRVGRVDSLDLLRSDSVPAPAAVSPGLGRGQKPLVRATIELDEAALDLLGTNSIWQVGTQGIIGENYLEVTPGATAGAPLQDGAALRGVDAPRLHVMALQLSSVLSTLSALLGTEGAEPSDVGASLGSLVQTVNSLVTDRQGELGQALDDLIASASELRALVAETRAALGQGKLDELMGGGQQVVNTLRRDLPDLLQRATETLAAVEVLSQRTSQAVDPEAVAAIVADLRTASQRLAGLSREAEQIMGKVRRGEGTVGGLIQDPQIYDDLKEMLRDLKRHPWKFLWRD